MIEATSRTRALADDPALGCGNFLPAAIRASADPDAPRLLLDRPYVADGRVFEALSLRDLDALAEDEARAYACAGVRAGDVVAVSVEDGPGYLVHFVALTRLGAIAALINPNMAPSIAALWTARVGAIGLIGSRERVAAIAPHLTVDLRFVTSELPRGDRQVALDRHVHAPDDVVLLCHSSGTTGIPKAITFRHHGFFYGIRERLTESAPPRVLLSALPHSHSAGIAFPMLALLRDEPVVLVRGEETARVLDAIERHRATTIVAFPHCFVDIAQADRAGRDLSSVRAWVNTGDAAHCVHVRELVALGGPQGSVFIDGLGSSEMGFSLFRVVFSASHTPPARCVGEPLPFVDAQVFGPDGERLGPNAVGRLGVRAPTVTTGYWNDPELTERSRIDGYWLTGDLVFKDEAGRFTHVDRTTDVVPTAEGPFYTLLGEEVLQRGCRDLIDVCVVGASLHDGFAHAVAYVRPRPGIERSADAWLALLNDVLAASPSAIGPWPRLSAVLLPSAWADVPVGPTGKVLKRVLRERASAPSAT